MRTSYALIGLALDADVDAVLSTVRRMLLVSSAESVTGEFNIIAQLGVEGEERQPLDTAAQRIAEIPGVKRLRHCVAKHPRL